MLCMHQKHNTNSAPRKPTYNVNFSLKHAFKYIIYTPLIQVLWKPNTFIIVLFKIALLIIYATLLILKSHN